MNVTWTKTTEERYDEMLEVLPPATMTGLGFLVGEPLDHATCPITGRFGARFEAYAKIGNEFFVASEPMTVAGFKRLTSKDVKRSEA